MASREPTSIQTAAGHQLSAVLDLPEGEPRGLPALFAHCFTCGKDIRAASVIARTLAQAGVPVLRVDFTGLGHSEGEFGRAGLCADLADLHAARAWLRERFGHGPGLMIGHSLGGVAALLASLEAPEVRALVTIGTPADPSHVQRVIIGHEAVEEQGSAEVSIGGRPFRVHRQLLDELRAHERVVERVAAFARPLLILHAPEDRTVPLSAAGRLYAAARQPKSFVALDGADHLLSKAAAGQRAARIIAAWAAPYLELQPSPSPQV